MRLTLPEFIVKYTNKPVDTDGIYPNQCMDLMHLYKYEVLGLINPSLLAAPSAYLSFQNYKTGPFKKIYNASTNVPKPGDIVYFGTKVGLHGHVCIFIEGDVNKFRSFDSNWPVGSLPRIVEHNYNGALGWLRPIEDTINTIEQAKNNIPKLPQTKKFSLNKEDAVKILHGAGIALMGAGLTYISSVVSDTDFGVHTPLVVSFWSVVANTLRKYIAE